MKLGDYIKKHRPSVVHVVNAQEVLWRIYSAGRSGGLLLVPGPKSRELARAMFEQQSRGDSGAATWSAQSNASSHLVLLRDADAQQGTEMWFRARLDQPASGKWIELQDTDGLQMHAWELGETERHALRLTWKMVPELASFIAGQEAVGNYRAGLAQGRSPYLKVWTGDRADDDDVVVGNLDEASPDFSPITGEAHEVRWQRVAGTFRPKFARQFSIRHDTTVGRALGLHADSWLKLNVEQALAENEHWEVHSLLTVLKDGPFRAFRQNIVVALRELWNEQLAEPAHRALTRIKNGAPASITPLLSHDDGSGVFSYLQVYSVERHTGSGSTSSASFSLKWSGYTDDRDVIAPERQSRRASLVWPALKNTKGAPLKASSTVSTRQGAQMQGEASEDDGTLFELFVREMDMVASVRDGALDLEFGGEVPGKSHYGRLRATLHVRDEQRPLFLFQWDESLRHQEVVFAYAVEDLTFGVRVAPGGQDSRPEDELLAPATSGAVVQGSGERAEPPLLISLRNASTERFLWIASESTGVAQSIRLDVRLERYASTARDGSPGPSQQDSTIAVVVLDTAPQLVAKVHTRFLERPSREDPPYGVARRSPLSDERDGWELFDERALSDGFTLVLPAQALGEQMVKFKDDLPEPDDGKSPKVIADCRFGPPAHLQLAPERLNRGFVAVAWNLRRIILERASASPGVPLLAADFELLYGLTARIQHRGLLLTEVGSKVGELATPARPKAEWRLTRKQRLALITTWNHYLLAYRAWSTRLCVLELSHEHEPLRPLQLRQGISYRARVAVTDSAEPTWAGGARLAWPQPRGRTEKSEKAEPRILKPTPDLERYHVADGLKGGAFWGFEQLEVYREFWRHHRQSSSAEIADLAFSSLGGYGKQTARFALDKTTIQAVTTLGRTHIYAVERIGRIGVYWNKAKHVVLFERTVVRSKQFADQQHPHAGRVLCRRVREFVEILEPERQYPDIPEQDSSAPGAVRGSAFRTRIFPVDSGWGRTVYRQVGENQWQPIGWEIPLWREGLNPDVYPRPQVSLQLTAPTDSDVETVLVDLEHPEVLRFYTDTRDQDDDGRPLTSEVHKWPVVAGVDYVDQPDPEIPDIAPCAADMDERLPGAVPVPPGFERFTFLVSPSKVPADVAGAYFKDAKLSGRMRSVTLMRSEPIASSEAWWNARQALNTLVGEKGSVAAQAANGFSELLDELRAGRRALDSVTMKTFQDNVATVLAGAKKAVSGLPLDREPRADNFRSLYEKVPSGLTTLPGKALWREVLESADGAVVRVMAMFVENRRKLVAATSNLLDQGKRGSELVHLIDEFEERVASFHVPLQWQLSEAVSLARSYVVRLKVETAAAVGAFIRHGVTAHLSRIQNEASPDRLEDARQQIRELIDAAVAAAEAFLNDKLLRVGPQRDELVTKVRAFRGAATAAVDEVVDAVGRISGTFAERLENLVDELESTVHAVFDAIGKKIDDTEEALLSSVDIAAIVERLLEPLQRVRGTAEDVDLTIEEVKKRIEQQLAAIEDALKRELVDETGEFLVARILGPIQALDKVFSGIGSYFASLLAELHDHDAADAARALFNRLQSAATLADAIKRRDLSAVTEAATDLAEGLNSELGQLAGAVAELNRDLEQGRETVQAATNVLRNARSVWDEFAAPGLGFNRRTIELVARFNPERLDERLGLTPSVARLEQASERLEELGLRVPVVGVADRLLSATKDRLQRYMKSQLESFDFSEIISDIGGMRLKKLFPGLKFPQPTGDELKVTHGFDKDQLKAWADAESNVELKGSKTVMSIASLQLSVERARFTGKVRLETGADGRVAKVARGMMQADWKITVGGVEFMSYEKLRISFDDGKLRFDLDPARMHSPGLLQLMTDVSRNIPFENGSFNVGMVNGGLRADLELGPWGGSGGVSGISNLLFGAFFELRLASLHEFVLATGFHIGRKESPFDLQVFILGGGGYFDLALRYTPGTNALSMDVTLAVHASASLRIDVGWLRGGVAMYLGLEAEYHKRPGKPPVFHAGQFVMIEGYARVVSIVTVHLTLRLACTFKSLPGRGTELRGSGVVSVQVRISRFFKIRVRRTYERVLARSKGSEQKALGIDDPELTNHIEMLAP